MSMVGAVIVLDTGVLWPGLVRDLVLGLSSEGVYRARWSSATTDELSFVERSRAMSRGAQALEAASVGRGRVSALLAGFEGAPVTGWETALDRVSTPEAADAHVLAAAIVAGAAAVVTTAPSAFPPPSRPAGLEILEPAVLVLRVASAEPVATLRVIESLAERERRTADELMALFEAEYAIIGLAKALRG